MIHQLPTQLEADTKRAVVGASKLVLRIAILLVAGILVVAALVFLSSSARGFVRFLIAAALGVAIAIGGIGFFRQFANPPPPEPPPSDVPPEYGLVYVCDICGLELSVLKAAKEIAPKHCGEAMALLQRGSAP